MNIIVWLVIGGLIGWVASTVMRMPEGVLLNVVVGIVGAALGGWFLSPLVGASTINQSNFSFPRPGRLVCWGDHSPRHRQSRAARRTAVVRALTTLALLGGPADERSRLRFYAYA